MGHLLLIGAVLLLGYLISLRLHPNRKCRACKGVGRHAGSVFRYSTRQCVRCGGNGRRARLGIHVFHGGGRTWGERKPDEATARRARNFGR
jgi:hypothetical protein